jgi:hypothetical protein
VRETGAGAEEATSALPLSELRGGAFITFQLSAVLTASR